MSGLIGGLLCLVFGAHPKPSDSLVIAGASVIDGTGAPVRRNQWLLIVGDRIAALGSSPFADATGVRVLDGRGLTVTPGLSDLHVHLGEPVRAHWILKALLGYGVTRVKDPGNRIEALRGIRAILARDSVLPRVFISGQLFDGSRTELRFLKPGPALEAQLVENLALGVDFLKVHNWVSWEALLRIAAAGREAKVPLTGHVPLNLTSVAALDAGIDILEHVRIHPFELFDDPAVAAAYPMDVLLLKRIGYWARFTGRERSARRTLDAWVARRDRFFLDPTLVVHEALALGEAGFDRLDARRIVSPALWREWPGALPVYGRLTKAESAEALSAAAGMGRWVGMAHRRGIRILTGTDAPLPGTPPGTSLIRELELLLAAGLTVTDVVHASTGQAAAALRTPDVGLVAPGQRADLLLVRGDLARDRGALHRIEWVVLGGRVLDPAQLRADAAALARADSAAQGP